VSVRRVSEHARANVAMCVSLRKREGLRRGIRAMRMVILNKRGRRDQQAAAEPEVNSTLSPSARAHVYARLEISLGVSVMSAVISR